MDTKLVESHFTEYDLEEIIKCQKGIDNYNNEIKNLVLCMHRNINNSEIIKLCNMYISNRITCRKNNYEDLINCIYNNTKQRIITQNLI